jgi:hopanoid biosynthesis associated protein HpnK
MKRLIVNADDFGLSPGVNRGILSGFRNGILTSTTLMANSRYFDDAVAIAKENPDLPVGVHLGLVRGDPLSPPAEVRSLLDERGRLLDRPTSLAARYFLGRLSLEETERELRAQMEKVLAAGLTPTHVDTHKHVHCLPGILRAAIAAARSLGIEKVRLPYEYRFAPPRAESLPAGSGASWKARGRGAAMRWLSRNARAVLSRAGMKTTDWFLGIEFGACLDVDRLRLILRNLEDGVTEIMCHAGYVDDALRELSSVPPHRDVELSVVTDPRIREQIASSGIGLMSFGDL